MNSKIIVTLGLTGTVKLTEDCYADQDVIDAILYGDK